MQIYADVKDHVVFVVDPPYEQRGGFFSLLSTVVFRLAMLQSLLYPRTAPLRISGNNQLPAGRTLRTQTAHR